MERQFVETDPYIFHVVLSSDGSIVVAASVDRDVGVSSWRVSDGALLGTVPGIGPVALSPDGRTLAAWQGGERVVLWRSSDFALLQTFPLPPFTFVASLAFSQDSQLLAMANRSPSRDGSGTDLLVWRVTDGSPFRSIKVQALGILDMVFGPAENTVVVTTGGHTAHVIGLESGSTVGQVRHQGSPQLPADGRLLVTTSRDGTVVFWGVQ